MSGNTPAEAPSTIPEAILTLEEAPKGTVVATWDAINWVITHPNIYSELPAGFTFKDVLGWIDAHYDFTYTPFTVGDIENSNASNTTGSCKVFAYAKLLGASNISQKGILDLFAEHYVDVWKNSSDTSHPNIRAFMKCGIDGVVFHWENPLKLKK